MTAPSLLEALEGLMDITHDLCAPDGGVDFTVEAANKQAREARDAYKRRQPERLGYVGTQATPSPCVYCGEPADSHLCPEVADPARCAGATVPDGAEDRPGA